MFHLSFEMHIIKTCQRTNETKTKRTHKCVKDISLALPVKKSSCRLDFLHLLYTLFKIEKKKKRNEFFVCFHLSFVDSTIFNNN